MGVPAISAVGLSRRPDAPRILSKDGKLLSARLVQVQAIFRHGARTPVNDDGCNVDDTRCTWESDGPTRRMNAVLIWLSTVPALATQLIRENLHKAQGAASLLAADRAA